MNEKTAKLLKKYSTVSGENVKQLIAWWNSLPWNEKAKERTRMDVEIKRTKKA